MPRRAALLAAAGQRSLAVVSPDQVSNLYAWWKADAITGLNDGDAVARWPDSGSNGYNGTQAGTARPTYKTGIVNGKPIVSFDGTDDGMPDGGTASFTSVTMLAVVRPAVTTGNRSIRTANNPGGLQWRLQSGKLHLVRSGVVGIGVGGTTLSTSAFSVVAASYVSNVSWAVYLNGVVDGSGSTAVVLSTGLVGVIGGTGEYLQGDLAELIIYNTLLSSTDRGTVTSYLGNKYSISTS